MKLGQRLLFVTLGGAVELWGTVTKVTIVDCDMRTAMYVPRVTATFILYKAPRILRWLLGFR